MQHLCIELHISQLFAALFVGAGEVPFWSGDAGTQYITPHMHLRREVEWSAVRVGGIELPEVSLGKGMARTMLEIFFERLGL